MCNTCLMSPVCDSEVKLSVASFLSDRIVDEILESLSRSQHTLVGVLFTFTSTTFLFLLVEVFLVIPRYLSLAVFRLTI